jgi:AcrR family transcriptional regulator
VAVEQIAADAGISRATFYRMFGSREGLLEELGLEPDPDARERILTAAGQMLSRQSLAQLSMDELAAHAGVSRASLYRLFPGKPALFSAIVTRFGPLDAIEGAVGAGRDQPPDQLMPAIARAGYEVVSRNRGLVLAMFTEVNRLDPDTREGVRQIFGRLFASVAGYIVTQMQAGRLRTMHPILALAAFAGPLLLFSLARPVLETVTPVELPPGEEAVGELARAWVRAMAPDR